MTLADTPVEPEPEPTAPPPKVDPPGTADRRNPLQVLVGVVIRPRSTFDWLREHGGWNWIIPLGALLALTLVSRALAVPIEQKQLAEAMAQFQQQMGAAGNGVKGPNSTFAVGGGGVRVNSNAGSAAPDWVFSYGLPVAEALGGWALAALLLWGLAGVMGGRPSGGAMVRLSAWALIPSVVRLLIVVGAMVVTQKIPAQGLVRAFVPTGDAVVKDADTSTSGDTGTDSNSGAGSDGNSGPGKPVIKTFTVGPGGTGNFEGPSFGALFVNSLLMKLDLYTLWQLGLLGIGLVAAGKLSWIKSGLSVLIYWTVVLSLSTLPLLLGPLLGGLMGGEPGMIGP